MGSIPGSGRSPGGGHGNPPQYSCLENPRDRGAWRASVHRVAKSQTQLKQLNTHAGSQIQIYCFVKEWEGRKEKRQRSHHLDLWGVRTGEASLRKQCLCEDLKMYGRRQPKRGGAAFNFEGTENENSLMLGEICNSRTDQHSEKTSPLPGSIS